MEWKRPKDEGDREAVEWQRKNRAALRYLFTVGLLPGILSTVERPRRREYSAEFKAMVPEQVRPAGASVAGVALSHGLNPNMVHRWMREDR